MALDLGIDTASDWEEELRIEEIGGGHVIVFRPPTTKQISAVSLEMTGKRKNEGAVRDLLDSIVLSVDEVRAKAYGDEGEDEDTVLDAQLANLLEEERIVDIAFLIERMKDPRFTFDSTQFNKLVVYLLEQRTGFPTKPSSASPSGPTTTGQNSTASSRRAGSTRSGTSRRVASSA